VQRLAARAEQRHEQRALAGVAHAYTSAHPGLNLRIVVMLHGLCTTADSTDGPDTGHCPQFGDFGHVPAFAAAANALKVKRVRLCTESLARIHLEFTLP